MEQVPGVSSTVGLFHTIRVKLSSSGGAAMLQIWVDEVPLMPLTHGQLLANGKTCELPSLDQGRFLGFAANNGQGAFAKPLFRGLQVLAAAPAATVTYVETVPQLASRPVPHCVDGPKGHDCSNMVRDDAGNILQLSSPPAGSKEPLRLMKSRGGFDLGGQLRYASGAAQLYHASLRGRPASVLHSHRAYWRRSFVEVAGACKCLRLRSCYIGGIRQTVDLTQNRAQA